MYRNSLSDPRVRRSVTRFYGMGLSQGKPLGAAQSNAWGVGTHNLPYTPVAWTTHVVVMHTYINYKGACVIEVEQKCYSVISRKQEAKYAERHKSNGDTLIYPFPMSMKQPILDAVNMRQRTRRNGRAQPGPLQLCVETSPSAQALTS